MPICPTVEAIKDNGEFNEPHTSEDLVLLTTSSAVQKHNGKAPNRWNFFCNNKNDPFNLPSFNSPKTVSSCN